MSYLHKIPASPTARPPIIFIHGVYHGAWCWDEFFLDYFTHHGYEVYALNLRGHDTPADTAAAKKATFSDYLNDVKTLVDQTQTPPILIGHSMGGMLIQRYIEHHTIAGAVLLSTPTSRALRGAARRMLMRRPAAVLRSAVTLDTDRIYHDPAVAGPAFFRHSVPKKDVAHYLQKITKQPEGRWILPYIMTARFKTPKSAPPMLVIGGSADHDLPEQTFFDLAKPYGVTPHILSGMPHDMMLDPQWRSAADLIITWLGDNVPDRP